MQRVPRSDVTLGAVPPEGIRARHREGCAAKVGGRCSCKPAWEAQVYSVRDRRKIRRTFPTLAAARGWRADSLAALRRGTLRAPTPLTLNEAADALLEGMKSGRIRTRSGDRYKPSTIRSYETGLSLHVRKPLGGLKLSEIERFDLQRIVDDLLAEDAAASTIRNAVMPVRVIFRRALEDSIVFANPALRLRLPAVRGRRSRIAPPVEAQRLLAALEGLPRVIYACAFYAGLRLGELRGLRWGDVCFADGVIRVDRAMDYQGALIAPKTEAGRRSVPLVSVLRRLLIEHRLQTWPEGYVLGRASQHAFNPSTIYRAAKTHWSKADPPLAGIELHEARHTFASVLIDAGVNAKAVSTYMGHASIDTTFDIYGHLMPGNEAQAAELLDAYLDAHS
jgi:integrase